MFATIRRFRLVLAFGAALVLVPAAQGQTFTWIATQSGNWSTASNWSGGSIPVSGTTANLVFNAYLDNSYAATNDIATPFIAQTITVNNSSFNQGPTQGLTLVGPLQSQGTNAGIIDNGPGDLYIGPFSTTVGAVSTWNLASNATISGTNSGQIRINDQITGSGTLTINRPSTNLANNFVFFNLFSATSPANNFTGGVTLQAGDLAFGSVTVSTSSANPNIGTGTLTIASVGSGLTGVGEVRASSSATTILTMPVTINSGATFNQLRGTAIDFGTPVTGTGSVATGTPVLVPSAGFIFENANTYSGTTTATNTSIVVRGTNGALTGTSQIEMFRNSTLTLDSNSINPDTGNTLGNQVSQDRIPDATPVLFHNATLNLIANATASTTETIGTLTADGWNVIGLTPQTAAGATLTINNLVRSNRGTVDVRGTNLGGAVAGTANTADVILTQLNGAAPSAALVGGGGAAGSTNVSIIPYMTGSTAAGTAATTFVTYDTNGLRALNTSTEFAAAPAAGSTNNVRTTVPLTVAGAPSSANSLVLAAASAGVWGFGGLTGQLAVTSGAILVNPVNSTAYLNIGALNFGGKEAVLTSISASTINALNINSAVTNNAGLTYSGTGRTGLLSPNNVIGGPITIDSGLVTVNTMAQLGGATGLNLNGGGLTVAPLATGVGGDTLSLPITVGPAGGSISSAPVPANTFVSQSQVLTLTGAITGSGPLYINGAGAAATTGVPITGGGNVVLAGDASGFSGMVVINAGVVQIDSDARLGTNPTFVLASLANSSQPAVLHVTATTATNKNIYLGGSGFIQVDAGATYTVNGYISSLGSAGTFRKFGAGALVLTNQETFLTSFAVGAPAMTGNMNILSGTGVAAGGNFSGAGGTVTLRDQGAILSSIGLTVSAGGSLVLDNTGSANLSNRVNNATMNLAGGTIVMMGASSGTSSEFFGPATLAANSGSVVEVDPGAGQTASVYFSGPTTASTSTSGGLVRALTAGGSTLTLRAPGLGGTAAGTGQINFIHNVASPTGPTMIGGNLPGTPQVSVLPGVFGEDTASGAIGLVTLDTVAANPSTGFPQYYRSRLLNTATEYQAGSPDTATSTTNVRLTAAATATVSPTLNSLFVDVGGSLAITPATSVTLSSGTIVMAGGTSISGGTLAAAPDNDLSVYVGAGTATLGSDVTASSSSLPPLARTLAKAGPGTLSLTTALTANGISTVAIQRGTFQLGAGGSLPTTINVSVDAGATFDLNSPGTTVAIARLAGLGTIQLGSNAATILQVSPANYTSVFGGTIAGAGTLQITGTGTFEFGPTYSYSGPINVVSGTLQFNDSNTGFGPSLATVSGGAITASDGTTITYFGIQDFQRAININVGAGTGTVTLTSNFSQTSRFSGPITLANGKTLSITNSASGLYRYSGVISGTGNVTFNAGNSIIDAVNTYVGTTTFATASATFGIGSDSPFGSGTLVVSAAENVYAVGGAHTVPNPVTLNGDLTYGTANPVYQGFDLTFSGPIAIAANRTITATAAGKLTLTAVTGGAVNLTKAGGGTLALAGTNTYSGTTAVNVGTLLVNGTLPVGGGIVTVASGAALGGTGTINGDVTVNAGGTITVNGGTFTIGSLTGTAGTVNNNATTPGTLAVGLDNTSTSFGGSIVDGWTGALSLNKVGTGTLTLTNTPNTYSGGTNVSGGVVSVAVDSSLGNGPASAAPLGTLLYTGTTTASRAFPMTGGTISVAASQTVTFSGSQLTNGYLAGPGTFATNPATGAAFGNMTTRPSATLNSNSSLDQFVNFTNGGVLNIAASLPTPITMIGMTNAGSGSITIGSLSRVNVTDFQSYGLLNISTGASAVSTTMTNVGSTPIYFNGGSRTFIGTIGGNGLADLELNGQNAIVAGGLFVNNGHVSDNSIAGISTIIADYGALVKGAGLYDNSPITRNGGRFQSGNSPGVATFGRFVFGPGGVNSYVFAISNATGQAGPIPDASGEVSGWGLAKTSQVQRSAGATSGDFVWTADSTNKLTVTLDTLINPTIAGTDVNGLMANFDPTKSYSWPAVEWVGNYSGPTSVAALDAATAFDTSEFANPIAGAFGWSLDSASQTLSLTYTPSAVPEPGSLALVGIGGAISGWVIRRRRLAPKQV